MSINYIRLSAPPTITNSYCGLISSRANLIRDKEYILHFKCISYKPSIITVKFRKKDGAEIIIGQVNIEGCEILNIVNNQNEYYCILKFKSTVTEEGNVLIGTSINNTYVANEKILDIREVALQKGGLLLPYTQGAIDLGKEFLELNTKVEQLADSISLKASKIETKNMEERVKSAELKVSPEKITTTVMDSNRFTQFEQNIEGFQISIGEKINLLNIVKNGDLKGGTNHWWGSETSGTNFYWDVYHNQMSYGLNGRSALCMSNKNAAFNEKSVWSNRCYKVEPNTDYTLCFHYIAESNVSRLKAYVVMSDTEDRTYGEAHEIILVTSTPSQTNLAKDSPYSFKFNSGSRSWVWLRFDHDGVKNTSLESNNWIYITDVAIYKGDVGSVKFVPNKNEMYGTTIKIDEERVLCNFSNGSYNEMGSEGNMWKAPNMEYPYHFLSYQEAISITTDGSNNYTMREVKLPARFNYVKPEHITIKGSLKGWYKYTGDHYTLESISVSTGRVYRKQDGNTYAEVACKGHIRLQGGSSTGLQVNVILDVGA